MKSTFRKSSLSLLLASALLLSALAACSSSSKGGSTNPESTANTEGTPRSENYIGISGNDYTIAVGVLTFTVDYFKEVAYGAIQAGEDLGVKVVLYTGAIASPADQVALVENQIQTGVDAITFTPIDVYGMATAVDACNDAGIVTISETAILGGNTDVTTVIASDDITTGKTVAAYCADEIGGEGKVIILNTGAAIVNSQLKCKGIEDYFAENYPGIEVLANMACEGGDQSTGQKVMADLTQSFNDIDAVICINDTVALGACISLEEAGYTLGQDVKVYSCNYSAEISDKVSSGAISCGIYSWGQLFGYWSVEMSIRALNGNPVPTDIQQPNSLVTAANVEYYDAVASQAKNYDFDAYMANQ
jgi:ribose transport system substrate-binding protein